MAASKVAAKRDKAESKAAQELSKKSEAKEAHFIWTEDALIELLHFYRQVKDEHTELEKHPGFMVQIFFNRSITRFFHSSKTFQMCASCDNIMPSWHYGGWALKPAMTRTFAN
ncbi:hypothetical protein VP01_1663g5 [Puccinia sorghi]|uniref:Uncharacterized protein n=1 Tax=Puccinia sorghi TaxID=27349 RepID=A0A0L6VI30_9BASI|nr:hypothetical protein VP01_1663g5 [Puccinia sorghi]